MKLLRTLLRVGPCSLAKTCNCPCGPCNERPERHCGTHASQCHMSCWG
jgi:hypothetical protein